MSGGLDDYVERYRVLGSGNVGDNVGAGLCGYGCDCSVAAFGRHDVHNFHMVLYVYRSFDLDVESVDDYLHVSDSSVACCYIPPSSERLVWRWSFDNKVLYASVSVPSSLVDPQSF